MRKRCFWRHSTPSSRADGRRRSSTSSTSGRSTSRPPNAGGAYYTLPILYGDQLVARLDPRLERAAETLVVKGFWLDGQGLEHDGDFADALARGLGRLAELVKAAHVDAAAIEPARLRRHIEAHLI